MTLNSIDQALNVVLTGLIYGSGTWLACAFGMHIITRRQKIKPKPVLLLAPCEADTEVKTFDQQDVPAKEESCAEDKEPSIEIIIEQPLPVTFGQPVAQPVIKAVESLADAKKEEEPEEKEDVTVQSLPSPMEMSPAEVASTEIVCEPVDWKKWKVTDLRRASIAKVCGVRTRPIGSRRNLLKADLIAQYEQQLKRLTKVPPNSVHAKAALLSHQEKIA